MINRNLKCATLVEMDGKMTIGSYIAWNPDKTFCKQEPWVRDGTVTIQTKSLLGENWVTQI